MDTNLKQKFIEFKAEHDKLAAASPVDITETRAARLAHCSSCHAQKHNDSRSSRHLDRPVGSLAMPEIGQGKSAVSVWR